MAIQPLSSEQQNIAIDNRINPFSNAQLFQKLLNPEIKALVEQLAHQPLLLEKVLIQQNEGLLIKLRSNQSISVDQNQSILIKLPANSPNDLEKLIKQLESSGKISITVNDKQQVQINISIPNSLKNTQLNLNTTSSLSNHPKLIDSNNTTTQLVFLKSEITPSGQLTLSQFSNPIADTNKIQTTDTTTQVNAVKTLNLHNNLGKIASSLIAPNSTPTNKLSTDFTKIESLISQVKEQLAIQLNSSIVTNNYVKQIEIIGLKKGIILDVKNTELVKQTSTDFIKSVRIINLQIQKFFEGISKPINLENITQTNSAGNTKNLVSRLIKSGNLFENALKQQTVKNDVSPLSSSQKMPSDNKLILSQLITQLERLLVEISRYTEKPITANHIEKIERSLFTQGKEFTPLEQHQLATSKKIVLQKIQAQQEQLQNLVRTNQSLQGSIKSALHQIEQNQLHSLKSEQFNLQQFLVDLPIKQNGLIDSFEMRFESQDNKSNGIKKKYWKVVVRFDLEPLGPMFAEIQFENEKLSTHIFAQEKDTANLINLHLPTLRKSLFSAGVELKKVSGSQGNVPEDLKKQKKPNIDAHV